MIQRQMNPSKYLIIILLLSLLSCKTQKSASIYESQNLQVERLTKHTYRHISYLSTTDFGKVSCNGMVVIDDKQALIFDTPTNNDESKALINWVEKGLNAKVIGVVVTHFHNDCLGGLDEFHKRGIPSYASLATIELARRDSLTAPEIGFENYLEIKVGNKKVVNEFLGEGHTSDNIVSYFPDEKVLFGGCLIKTLGASKGYLGDANISEWPSTVKAVRSKYEAVKVVIPGHGEPGGSDLLDYTINLFEN